LPVVASHERIFYIDPNLIKNRLSFYQLDKFKLTMPVIYGAWWKKFTSTFKIYNKNYLTTESNIFFSFNTEKEAENCKLYLNTNFALFLKNIIQSDRAYSPFVFEYIPYMDFSIEWTDKKIFKHFKFIQEEIDYINNNAQV
jgi:hypothetical protein